LVAQPLPTTDAPNTVANIPANVTIASTKKDRRSGSLIVASVLPPCTSRHSPAIVIDATRTIGLSADDRNTSRSATASIPLHIESRSDEIVTSLTG